MKDKNDTKTIGLALAKTNAERQKEYRDRIKHKAVRLCTFITPEADAKLTLIMQRYDLQKKEAVSLLFESLSKDQIDESLAVVLRDSRKWGAK